MDSWTPRGPEGRGPKIDCSWTLSWTARGVLRGPLVDRSWSPRGWLQRCRGSTPGASTRERLVAPPIRSCRAYVRACAVPQYVLRGRRRSLVLGEMHIDQQAISGRVARTCNNRWRYSCTRNELTSCSYELSELLAHHSIDRSPSFAPRMVMASRGHEN